MPVWALVLVILGAIALTAAVTLAIVWGYIVWSSMKDWGQ